MKSTSLHYDFDHPILKKDRKYRRYAREHMAMSEIKSDVITWEVKEEQTALNIPVKYHVHYNIKSITGIDEDQNPIFGNHHTLEISFPPRYPLVPCAIKMVSPVWHPNIKSDGNYKGRICGNVKNFGKAYDLSLLVLRIGEILQYKNYHAEHIPPYPEDAKVAEWVVSYAEPNDIVSNLKGIVIDNTPLLRPFAPDTEKSSLTQQALSEQVPNPTVKNTAKLKIKILQQREKEFKKSKLVIKLKDKGKNTN